MKVQRNYQMTVTHTVPEQHLLDVLTTAWEGGIDYWIYEDFDGGTCRRNSGEDLCVNKIWFQSADGKKYEVGPADIMKAARRVLATDQKPLVGAHIVKMVRSLATEDPDVDADGADCLVQIAAFGEVVYG